MSSLRSSAPPRSAHLAPGATLAGKYRVERVVAEGIMGMVVEATDTDLPRAQTTGAQPRPRAVTIRLLRAERCTPELEGRFEREARVAARLTGAHLVRVLDAGRTEKGDPFLVTERLSGHDLAAELADRGPLPIAEAIDLILEACAGVAEVHAAGLVHRNLSPHNLFLAREGPATIVKVLDFGLSKAAHEKGQMDLADTEAEFGTPQYMAPEQIRAAKDVDARADQHALGALLHELCTGRPPFTAPSALQLAVAIAVEPPPRLRSLLPEVARGLDAAVCRALAKSPGERFPDLAAFAEAIAPWGGERGRRALAEARASLHRKRVW